MKQFNFQPYGLRSLVEIVADFVVVIVVLIKETLQNCQFIIIDRGNFVSRVFILIKIKLSPFQTSNEVLLVIRYLIIS